jgi:hypothetical protein
MSLWPFIIIYLYGVEIYYDFVEGQMLRKCTDI